MRPFQITVISLVSWLAIFTEFQSIKDASLFFAWADSVPFIGLCALSFIFLLVNIRRYRNSKKIISFLPLSIGALAILAIIWHIQSRNNLDNSATNFTAATYQIGSDGGFILDFKKNGHLKAERRDHWSVTYYWGNYTLKKDTIQLDLPLDFKLGKQAILTANSLQIIGDTIRFEVYKQ